MIKTFNYYVLASEVGQFSQKVRKLISRDGDVVSLRLEVNVRDFKLSEVIGVPSFIKGDILVPSRISGLISDRFVAIGGNHKFTKVLRISDGHLVTHRNIDLVKKGSIFDIGLKKGKL